MATAQPTTSEERSRMRALRNTRVTNTTDPQKNVVQARYAQATAERTMREADDRDRVPQEDTVRSRSLSAHEIQRDMAHERYMQSVSQGIAASRVAAQAQPQARTDAQIKQDLHDERDAIAQQQGGAEQSSSILRELNKQEKIVAKYRNMNWTMLYMVAFLDDLIDIIPIPGMSLLTSLYITVKLRKVGPVQKQRSRMWWRIFLMIIDMIPIINIAPISLGIVYNAQESERKRVAKARDFVKKHGKN